MIDLLRGELSDQNDTTFAIEIAKKYLQKMLWKFASMLELHRNMKCSLTGDHSQCPLNNHKKYIDECMVIFKAVLKNFFQNCGSRESNVGDQFPEQLDKQSCISPAQPNMGSYSPTGIFVPNSPKRGNLSELTTNTDDIQCKLELQEESPEMDAMIEVIDKLLAEDKENGTVLRDPSTSIALAQNRALTNSEKENQISCAIVFLFSTDIIRSFTFDMTQKWTCFFLSNLKGVWELPFVNTERIKFITALYAELYGPKNSEISSSIIIKKILSSITKKFNTMCTEMRYCSTSNPFGFSLFKISTCYFCKKVTSCQQKHSIIYEMTNNTGSLQSEISALRDKQAYTSQSSPCECKTRFWSTNKVISCISAKIFFINVVNCRNENPFSIEEILWLTSEMYMLHSFIIIMKDTDQHVTYYREGAHWYSFSYTKFQVIIDIDWILQHDKNIAFLCYKRMK